MRQLILTFLLLLSGCATIVGDRTVHITGEQIAQKLNEKLTVPVTLLKVFDVHLANATVTFDEKTGRMTTLMDSFISSPLFEERSTGKVGLSGKLRFDAAKSAVVLDEPMLEQFTVNGLSSSSQDWINGLAKSVGGELLNGLVLYQVKPEELTWGQTRYTPREMLITQQGLEIQLSPTR